MNPHLCTAAALVGVALVASASVAIWRQSDPLRDGLAPSLSSPQSPATQSSETETDLRPLPPAGFDFEEEGMALPFAEIRGTVYYTPRESGFDAAAGFDVTPVTKPGLKGHLFPRDFLKAVQLEGFGRLRKPIGKFRYIASCRGQWSFAIQPVDRRGKPLRALSSAAVANGHTSLPHNTVFQVVAANLPHAFRQARWQVCDTGSTLKPSQIDFYWGEDDPLGPGPRLSRPRGMPLPITAPSIIVLR